MRTGPKGLSPAQKEARGETRPSRAVVTLFADHASRPDPDIIPSPTGMTAAARKIWAVKVERFKQRGFGGDVRHGWALFPQGCKREAGGINRAKAATK